MTCREFKNQVASLGLPHLLAAPDGSLSGHAQKCQGCSEWLGAQRDLATSMHALRGGTAHLAPTPQVERAVLQAFRSGVVAGVVASPASANRLSVVPANDVRHAPVATGFVWRLSRFFEIGAYVAAVAAVLVLVFLGAELLHRRSTVASVQSAPAPAVEVASHSTVVTAPAEPPHVSKVIAATPHAPVVKVPSVRTANAETENETEAGYMPLMFCDPLSCGGETQVVRMELPQASGAQPQMADVVVGFDGIVRAVRFVE